MPFTSCTVTVNNIASLSDLPNTTDGLTSTQLKEKFDQASTDLKTYLNSTLLTELARTTTGLSATENIGGRTIPSVTGSTSISAGTLYSQLLALQTKIGSFVSGTGFMPITGGTFTGSVLFPDGTEALPSISNSDDSDTGIYFPLANRLAITTGGIEALRVDAGQRFVFQNTINQQTRFGSGTVVPNFQMIGDSTSATNSGSWFLSGQYSSDAVSGRLFFTKSRSATKNTTTSDGHISVLESDSLGLLSFAGSDGEKYVEAARISVEVDGTPGISDMPGRLRFLTTADNAQTPSERMRITQDGNVGIATTSPGAKLHIDGDLLASSATSKFSTRFSTTSITPDYQFFATGAGSAILAGRFSADASSSRIYFAKSRNATAGSHTVVQSGDQLGVLSFGGSDGTLISEGARISVEVDGTPGTNDMPGRIVFLTTADGSATPTERLRISSTGLLTSPQTYAQLVTASVRTVLVDSAGQIGNATSSLRHKESIEDLTVNVEDILKLEAKTFFYKEDVKQNGENAIRTVGFIAEQAKDLGLTYLYNEDEDGLPDYFAYDKFSVYLLQVVKKQQQTIESLQTRIELLESKVN